MIIQLAAIVPFLIGMGLMFAAYRVRQAVRPAGRVVNKTKERELFRPNGPLVAPGIGLAGWPSAVMRFRFLREVAPVLELDGTAPHTIPFALEMEAVALCWVAEQVYGQPAPRALLRYDDMDISLPRTADLDAALTQIVGEMRAEAEHDRSHDDPAICAACSVRELCSQSLA